MKLQRQYIFLALLVMLSQGLQAQHKDGGIYHEPYRPQLHFSPAGHWMNDPNGMVYNKGVYHLFFQYYPKDIVWGPMHWGHATSSDLMHWKQLPIALYPDSLGYIFSGSAVIDSANTSGFGVNGKAPMVAIFTHHDPKGEKAGTNVFQNESIAYSLDNGISWVKYKNNPVLKNPGITDFRDPKVFWYGAGKKWIMTLATKTEITFYSSPNLKDWSRESGFGKDLGAHGGVWECPDLFQLSLNGKSHWVLIINLNPGGPNGGSGTQYFIGQFDGKAFTADNTETSWLDYGPDEYAGVTWSGTGNRKIFLGWMSNWLYANLVPTEKWRNSMTIPRDLALKSIGTKIYLSAEPSPELSAISSTGKSLKNADLKQGTKIALPGSKLRIHLNMEALKAYALTFSNKQGNKVVVGYDASKNEYYIDRSAAGKSDFYKGFAGRFTAPRIAVTPEHDLTLVMDDASLELFADQGLTVMTGIYFPESPLNQLTLSSTEQAKIKEMTITPLKGIW